MNTAATNLSEDSKMRALVFDDRNGEAGMLDVTRDVCCLRTLRATTASYRRAKCGAGERGRRANRGTEKRGDPTDDCNDEIKVVKCL